MKGSEDPLGENLKPVTSHRHLGLLALHIVGSLRVVGMCRAKPVGLPEDFPSLVIRAQCFANDANVFHRVFNEWASFDRGLFFAIHPRPHGLSRTFDATREFCLAAADVDSKLQNFQGGERVGFIHESQHKPLFKDLQTLVYGARTHLFIRCAS